MRRSRLLLASGAVTVVAAVAGSAALLGPPGQRVLMLVVAALATAMAVQAVASEPRDLTAALLIGLVPVVVLGRAGAPGWWIGSMAALLLFACEMATLSWECRGSVGMSGLLTRRLVRVAGLVSVAVVASWSVGVVARTSPIDGTLAVVVAAAALAGVGGLLFRGGSGELGPSR